MTNRQRMNKYKYDGDGDNIRHSHSPKQTAWRVVLILAAVVSYIVGVTCTAISNIPSISLWNKTISEASRDFPSGITPPSDVFKIWWFIYFTNALMCLYLLVMLFRRFDGRPLFMAVQFIPDAFLYSYTLIHISGPFWITVLTRDEFIGAQLLMVLAVVCLLVCLITVSKAMDENGPIMEHRGLMRDLWTLRIIVQNALAVYIGWLCCATLITLNTTLIYACSFNRHTASFISLGILNGILVIWFILETFVFDRQLRYTFSHYIPFMMATGGNFMRSYDPSEPVDVYMLVLMIVSCSLALIKLTTMLVRGCKDPIRYPRPNDEEKTLELSMMNNGYQY